MQIGNFIVTKYGKQVSRYKIQTVSNDWNLSFMEGTEMYLFIDTLIAKGNVEVLRLLIITWYQLSTTWRTDEEFYKDWVDMFDRLYKRIAERTPPSEEDEKEILDEMKKAYTEDEGEKRNAD